MATAVLVRHTRRGPYAAASPLMALSVDDLTATAPAARIATPMAKDLTAPLDRPTCRLGVKGLRDKWPDGDA